MPRPFRYTLILLVVGLCAALAAIGGWRFARTSAPVSGPIVLISIDTLRADHLPAYGYDRIATPAIDELARDGVVFERAYAQAPLTLPAHASILTGRLPFDTGIRDNAGFVLKSSERTLAEMLRDRGYATGAAVSSSVLSKESGIARGFDVFDAEMAPASPDSVVGGLRRDGADSERVAEEWLAHVNTPRALLFLHLYEPHGPSPAGASEDAGTAYDSRIVRADAAVGQLTRYLKAHQLYEQATIILVADHGEGLGDHGERAHGLFLYQEALHIPLIVKSAGREGAGRRVKALVQQVDVTPTVLDLAKAPIPGNLRGLSLTPLLEGQSTFPARFAYAESFYGQYHFGAAGLLSLTDGERQYIRAPTPEFYDLTRDPRQRENLAAHTGDQAHGPASFSSELDRVIAGVPAPDAPGEVSPDVIARLEALGYVGTAPPAEDAAGPADPKDLIGAVEARREAAALATGRQWTAAIAVLQRLTREQPRMTDAWRALGRAATLASRHDLALDAHKHVAALAPDDARPHLDAAAALLRLRKLDEARKAATAALELAGESHVLAGSAHEALARIALARRDAATVRAEAELARAAEPRRPLAAYLEGRLLLDEGHAESALKALEEARDGLASAPDVRPIAELHLSLGEALVRLERPAEAESELLQELATAPQNARAWTALVTMFRAAHRVDEAGAAIDRMLRLDPTADGYAAAERLLVSLGDRPRAASVRADAKRLFPAR